MVYRLTGSALALGATWFLPLLPVIPLTLLGGALTDRVPSGGLVILTQVGCSCRRWTPDRPHRAA
ncbi:hypothetical protein [Candidatus Amarolinea aalborgensis]|uniref:hypothetical protein n=1 Tax=Candidatus Amarolinea aalborgensis TaxID=2249329 RepID=UPI003BFA0A1C